MKLVILESPYGNKNARMVQENVMFARLCLHDCLLRGEAPIASHLLYTQEGVLRDDVPEERAVGIAAGIAWRRVADYSVFYTDRGWSSGMLCALESAVEEKRLFFIRGLLELPQLLPSTTYEMEKFFYKQVQFGAVV